MLPKLELSLAFESLEFIIWGHKINKICKLICQAICWNMMNWICCSEFGTSLFILWSLPRVNDLTETTATFTWLRRSNGWHSTSIYWCLSSQILPIILICLHHYGSEIGGGCTRYLWILLGPTEYTSVIHNYSSSQGWLFFVLSRGMWYWTWLRSGFKIPSLHCLEVSYRWEVEKNHVEFQPPERAEFVACIGITSCHWYISFHLRREQSWSISNGRHVGLWLLVTSNLVRTCRSWFEMESLEMKKNSGDILKPVKTRPQYKHIRKEIWQVFNLSPWPAFWSCPPLMKISASSWWATWNLKHKRWQIQRLQFGAMWAWLRTPPKYFLYWLPLKYITAARRQQHWSFW